MLLPELVDEIQYQTEYDAYNNARCNREKDGDIVPLHNDVTRQLTKKGPFLNSKQNCTENNKNNAEEDQCFRHLGQWSPPPPAGARDTKARDNSIYEAKKSRILPRL